MFYLPMRSRASPLPPAPFAFSLCCAFLVEKPPGGGTAVDPFT